MQRGRLSWRQDVWRVSCHLVLSTRAASLPAHCLLQLSWRVAQPQSRLVQRRGRRERRSRWARSCSRHSRQSPRGAPRGPAGAAACRHISTACQLASRSFEPARQHRGSAPLTSTTLVRCPCLQDVCQREGPAGGGGPEQRPGEQDAGICAAPIQRRPPGDRRAPVQPISGAGFYWVHIHLQPQVGGVRGVWADGGLVGPELLHGQRAACLAVRRSAPVDTLHNAPSVPFPTHITLPAICAGAS